MERTLKYALVSIVLMVGLGCCKHYQHRNWEEQRSLHSKSQYESHGMQQETMQRDSLSRYWIFWSDSAFRFHPDSGLSGYGGRLFVQESKASTNLRNRVSTAVRDIAVQTAIKETKEKSKSVSVQRLWLIGLIGIVFVVAWKIRKFLKALS